ncbi:hypothetical protein D3C80_800530 [compost metagenome]
MIDNIPIGPFFGKIDNIDALLIIGMVKILLSPVVAAHIAVNAFKTKPFYNIYCQP